MGIEILKHLLNRILKTMTIRMPEEWRNSTLMSIYVLQEQEQEQGVIQDFGNYRAIKLMLHTMNIWVMRVMDQRLVKEVTIS